MKTHRDVSIPDRLQGILVLSCDPNAYLKVPGEARRAIEKSVDDIEIILDLERYVVNAALKKFCGQTYPPPFVLADTPSLRSARSRKFLHFFRHVRPCLPLESHQIASFGSPFRQKLNESELFLSRPDCVARADLGTAIGRGARDVDFADIAHLLCGLGYNGD